MNKSNLSTKALLNQVIIRQWAARKSDKKANETVRREHGASSEAGNFAKKLLPNCSELTRVNNKAQEIRDFVYSQSLPWTAEGLRIIKAENFIDFNKDLSAKINEFDHLVDQFCLAYKTAIDCAILSLGDLFNAADYPTDIRSKFGVEVNYFPLPDASDFRVTLGADQINKFNEIARATEINAMKDAYSRLIDVTSKAVEKLSDPKAIFRDSLLSNIEETCAIINKINMTDDPELETRAKEIAALVKSLSPQSLRTDANNRAAAAQSLKSINDSMSIFMDGAYE